MFGGDSTPKGPSVVFDSPRGAHTQHVVTTNLKIPYWVNPRDLDGLSHKEKTNLHKHAETKYIHLTNSRCETEIYKRNQAEQAAQGWFGPDQEKMAEVRKMPMTNCRKLQDLGFQVRY